MNAPHDLPTDLLVPPHSLDAEQAVLGALLIDARAWDRIDGLLAAEDFYRHGHRLIFAAVAGLGGAIAARGRADRP